MSWEDCGMKPGRIFGPETCRECEACDGLHHFVICNTSPEYEDDDDAAEVFKKLPVELKDHPTVFVCKHCGTFAEAVLDED